MAPINPYATPSSVPFGQPANPAPVRSAPAAPTGFTAGLDAPRATSRLSDLITSEPQETQAAGEAQPAAAASVQKGFSLQQISAYAGLVMAAESPVQPAGEAQAPAPMRNAPGERPLRPGSRLDFTV